MSDRNDVQAKLEDQLANAHEQLLMRDQRINELECETAALRVHLESVLTTRAWRAAETFRRLRHVVLRRDV
jgi:hypothetical protein